jgi:hypothetical protein
MRISQVWRAALCVFVLAFVSLAQDARVADPDVPSGPSLSEGEVIILLQAKVPLDTIQKFVAGRGVSFISSKESSKRILSAGGNVALIGTINLNQKEDAPVVQQDGKKKK